MSLRNSQNSFVIFSLSAIAHRPPSSSSNRSENYFESRRISDSHQTNAAAPCVASQIHIKLLKYVFIIIMIRINNNRIELVRSKREAKQRRSAFRDIRANESRVFSPIQRQCPIYHRFHRTNVLYR